MFLMVRAGALLFNSPSFKLMNLGDALPHLMERQSVYTEIFLKEHT